MDSTTLTGSWGCCGGQGVGSREAGKGRAERLVRLTQAGKRQWQKLNVLERRGTATLGRKKLGADPRWKSMKQTAIANYRGRDGGPGTPYKVLYQNSCIYI